MLDLDSEGRPLTEAIASLPCYVELPPDLREHFEKRGAAGFTVDDRRRFPRFFCRGVQSRAGLKLSQTLPALKRTGVWHGVYLADVSRGGVRFLHSEPLYPTERMRIVLGEGAQLDVEVVRCRRLHQRCFEIGAQYYRKQDAGEASE